jgi:CheY-like chemotaxis protein
LLFQLGSAGIDVRTYEPAVVFLEVAPTIQTGCIITDVRMPELSGIDLLRRVRELKLAVPVIVITAHGDIPLAVEAMRLGAVDFLEKPFETRFYSRPCGRRSMGGSRSKASGRAQQYRGPARGVVEPRARCPQGTGRWTCQQAVSLSDLVRMALIAGILDPNADASDASRTMR